MIRTFRVGAFASAGLLLASFLGVGIAGATAQEQNAAEQEQAAQTTTAASDAVDATGAANQDGVRFVSHPVVQQLPQASDASNSVSDPADAASLPQLVAEMTNDKKLSPQLACVAKAVYFESRGENLAGQLAVAEVVINRAQSSVFPDKYCAVVTQPAQFSFVRNGHIPTPRAGPAWQRARAIARIAHRDLWQSAAADALYFHAKRVNPRWAHRMVLAATIDSHIFYK